VLEKHFHFEASAESRLRPFAVSQKNRAFDDSMADKQLALIRGHPEPDLVLMRESEQWFSESKTLLLRGRSPQNRGRIDTLCSEAIDQFTPGALNSRGPKSASRTRNRFRGHFLSADYTSNRPWQFGQVPLRPAQIVFSEGSARFKRDDEWSRILRQFSRRENNAPVSPHRDSH
jgi:hypothetical protein